MTGSGGLRLRLFINLLAAAMLASPLLVLAALPSSPLGGWAAFGAFVVFVLAALLLLERAVVARLGAVDRVLGRMASLDLGAADEELLPSGGEALGRLNAQVNRLVAALRAERDKTARQIAALSDANARLREAQEGLVRSERLATVGQLAAGVAHEVGNPLAAIAGYAEILRGPAAAAHLADYAERIERETRRIDRIVRDLLDLARPPSATALGAVDLARAAATARRLVEPQQAWAGLALHVELGPALPPVRAQEHYLVQILVNLLANAAQAIRGARASGGEVKLRATAEGGDVVVEVLDDGPGIPPASLPRLFTPFFTTKAPGEGTGLGLAICLRLAETFGATLSAANRPEGGAVFTLRLKAA